jgi:hypothetical protein
MYLPQDKTVVPKHMRQVSERESEDEGRASSRPYVRLFRIHTVRLTDCCRTVATSLRATNCEDDCGDDALRNNNRERLEEGGCSRRELRQVAYREPDHNVSRARGVGHF